VYCVGASDCWAVGIHGAIIQWTGSSWATVTGPGSFNDGNSVYCVNANDCWAVGTTIIQWTGSSWATVADPASSDLNSVFIDSGWAVGYSGTIIRGFPTTGSGATATGLGTATFSTSAGGFQSLTASAVGSVSPPPPSGLSFPDGLFSFTIVGLTPGQTVTVTITLPTALPSGDFVYYKFQSAAWTQFPSASLDSTRTMVTLTLTADSNGVINDPGGPAITPPVTTATTFAPVHQTPVGGVMLPSVGFTVLLPWVIVLSLLGVLSVEAFRVKRRAKQR